MNRLTRITSILIHLQSKRIVTAKEIADRYDISIRTVYRDIKTLQDAGVPIGSENGVGYFIVDGYSLPPVMITEEEANAINMAEKLVQNQGDESLIKDYKSFHFKIKSILRNSEKENIYKLDDRIILAQMQKNLDSNSLSVIQKAISNAIVLKIKYHSIYKDEITTRKIEPLGLYFTEKVWVVISYCRVREETRQFRLDRILEVSTTNELFNFQDSFKLSEYFEKLTDPS